MRNGKLVQAMLLVLLVVSPRCSGDPSCSNPPTDLDPTPPAQGVLPQWAVGNLSLSASVGYVANFHITEDGVVYQQLPPDDTGNGGCFQQVATAAFVNDRVVITMNDGSTQDLVHTRAGGVFLGLSSGWRLGNNSCNWTRLVQGPLCQRDHSDCAGSATIHVCTMTEALDQFSSVPWGDCPQPGAAPDGGVADGGVTDGGVADGGVADGGVADGG